MALQCVAVRWGSVLVRCSVMECVGMCYSMLECVGVCCSVLQCVTVCWSVLQLDTSHCESALVCRNMLQWRCSVLQCVAMYSSVLQCVAVCCSLLQSVAMCCRVLQCIAGVQQHTAMHTPLLYISLVLNTSLLIVINILFIHTSLSKVSFHGDVSLCIVTDVVIHLLLTSLFIWIRLFQ